MKLRYLIPVQKTPFIKYLVAVHKSQQQRIHPGTVENEPILAIYNLKALDAITERARLETFRKILERL